MPLSIQDIAFGIVAPAVCAMFLFLLGCKFTASSTTHRNELNGIAAAFGIASATLLGCRLLGTAPIIPSVSRDWLPYIPFLALVPALPIGPRQIVTRFVLLTLFIGLAAWLLVPDWEVLKPHRTAYLAGWFGLTLVLCIGSAWSASDLATAVSRQLTSTEDGQDLSKPKFPGRRTAIVWLGVTAAALLAAAAVLALSGSLRFAQTTTSAAAGCVGLCVAMRLNGQSIHLRSSGWVCSVFLAATMLTGQVNSHTQIPLISYLLFPFAPLACAIILARARSNWRVIGLAILAAFLLCAVGLGIAIAAQYESLVELGSGGSKY